MQRIAFTGKSGSGKSTAARHLEEQGFVRLSFAHRLKEVVEELYGVDCSSSPKPPATRKLLQDFGVALRTFDPDVWVRALSKDLNEESPSNSIVVDDLRFQNEADFLRHSGFIIVRLVRESGLSPLLALAAQGHISETEQDSIRVDHTIHAASLASLITQVSELVPQPDYDMYGGEDLDVCGNTAEDRRESH